ncbi:MAG: hypothetical protein ABIO48_08355 [Pedococcus sp.]
METFNVTPEQASHGRVVPDRELPMLAAQWLVEGYDSPLLRTLASLSPQEALQGHVALADVLAELGFPIKTPGLPYEELPWRGQWEGVWWAVDQMDRTHSPYASAQYVIEVIGDHEDLWEPGGGYRLMALLRTWDAHHDQRSAVDDQIRDHLRNLSEDQVPPLREQK